jgi:hypothetical protein
MATTPLAGQNSFQGFLSLSKQNPPSYSNLYWVRFRTAPKIFTDRRIGALGSFFNAGLDGGNEHAKLLTYYASDVTIPSRQLTTGEAKTVGNMYRYATGTSFSEISMQFILPRNLATRTFFERWMNYTANDASNRVCLYSEYVCPFIDIFKYERGGVPSGVPDPSYSPIVSPDGKQVKTSPLEYNRCSGVWSLSNAYPFNISNINLNAGPANIITMEVSFYYERYRFYVPDGAMFDEMYNNFGPSAVGLKTATPDGISGINASNPTTIVTSDGKGGTSISPLSSTSTTNGFDINGRPLTPLPARLIKEAPPPPRLPPP